MSKFLDALEKSNQPRIIKLLENQEIDIDENLCTNGKLHCLEYTIKNNDHDMFTFLLEAGANPLCSISEIIKNNQFLTILLDTTKLGLGLDSPLFPYVAKRFLSRRGREKTIFRALVLKYDFPIASCGEWRYQTDKECKNYGNSIGMMRIEKQKKISLV